MEKTMTEKNNKDKRPYERPKLRVIDLVADEVLAIGCKLSGGGQTAYGNTTYNWCTLPNRCYNPAS